MSRADDGGRVDFAVDCDNDSEGQRLDGGAGRGFTAPASFDLPTIKHLLRRGLIPGSKVSKDAVELSGEFLRVFVSEAVLRAADLALEEDVSNNRHDMDYSDDLGDGGTQVTIEPRHLQQMLIKLLLDF